MPDYEEEEKSLDKPEAEPTSNYKPGADEIQSARQETADKYKADMEQRRQDYDAGAERTSSSYGLLKKMPVTICDGEKTVVSHGTKVQETSLAADIADASQDRVRHQNPDGSVIVVDARGSIVNTTDVNGHTRGYGYDSKGKLNEMKDSGHRWTTTDGKHWVNEQGDQIQGRAEVSPDGSLKFQSDSAGMVSRLDGRTERIGSDKSVIVEAPDGKIEQTRDATGKTRTFQYGADGTVNGVTEADGSQWSTTDGETWTTPDGKIWKGTITLESDGTYSYVDENQKETINKPDGTIRVTERSGLITETLPDGTRSVIKEAVDPRKVPQDVIDACANQEQLDRVRGSVDTDGDGFLSKEEIDTAVGEKRLTGDDGRLLTEMQGNFDAIAALRIEGKNAISVEDLKRFAEIQAKEKHDTDQRRDMQDFVDKNFKSLDRDGNGFLSQDELLAAHADRETWNDKDRRSLEIMLDNFGSIRSSKNDERMLDFNRDPLKTRLDGRSEENPNDLGITVADVHAWVKDKSETNAHKAIGDLDRRVEKDRLNKSLDSHAPPLPEAKKVEFRNKMTEFEERAKQRGLSSEEVAKTYRELTRILDAKGNKPMSPDERTRIVFQVMDQAARPTTIDQGQHETCNVTVVESMMYTKEPAAAAKLVADVATTREYTAPDGTRVKLNDDSLRPDREAKTDPRKSGDRSYASQIFQVTAANVRYQQDERWLEYQNIPATASGRGEPMEKVIDHTTGKPAVTRRGKPVSVGDDFSTDKMARVYSTISGNTEDEIGLTVNPDKRPHFATAIKEKGELNDKLAELKQDGKLPVAVWVHTANEPFWSDSGGGTAGGAGGATGGGHYVTVTDYDAGPPARVELDNQWGEGNDHQWTSTDASGNKSIDPGKGVLVHDLFIAMNEPEEARELLRHDVEWNRSHNEIEADKEVELLRMDCITGKISQKQYSQGLENAIKDADERWKKGNYDPAEKAEGVKRIKQAVRELPPEQRLKVLHAMAKTDILTESEYESAVEGAVTNALSEKAKLISEGKYDTEQQQRYASMSNELTELLGDLPESRRQRLLARILASNPSGGTSLG